MARAASASTPGGVQSVLRTFQLLDLMSTAGGEMSVSELASVSGLPLPTIHRLIRTLLESGHVRQLTSRRYALGPGLIGLGESASRMFGSWARPLLTDLADTVGESANMALVDGDRAVYVAQVPSRHSMRMFTEVGRRVYLHCTGVGKALLAQMPDHEALAIVQRAGMPRMTPRTITETEALQAELDKIRGDGYTVDDGEQELGVRCVSVGVPGTPTLTAISVSGPSSRLTRDSVERAIPRLRKTAASLSEQFG